MNEQIVHEDLKTKCRACLKDSSLIPLYGASLDSMLMAIVSIKVDVDDQLPDKLCKSCCIQISRFYTFKQQCEKNDLILRSACDKNLKSGSKNNRNKTALNKQLLDEITFKKKVVDYANKDATEERNVENFYFDRRDNELAYSTEVTIDHTENLEALAGTSENFEKTDHNISSAYRCNFKSNDLELKDVTHKCDESFETIINLQAHVLQHTKKEKCETCGKLMSSTTALQRHIKIHAAVKPHRCDVCDMRFADIGNLRKHARKHTGELRNLDGKRFLCNTCGKAFKWYSSLYKHSKYHTGEKLYTCHLCDRQYVERKSLVVHIRGHTGERPHVCTLCDKRFTQKANLEKHKIVHTRKKPYSCPVCSKGFTQKSYIRVHMKRHTGERQFKCNLCPTSYSEKHSLKIHMHEHEAENLIESLESYELTRVVNPQDVIKWK